MPKRPSLCGAPKLSGETCRRPVAKAGIRCAIHGRRPKSGKEILKLCLKTVTKVSEVAAVSDLFIRLYPHIEPWVEPVRGLFMPEHFWEAFYAKDKERMELELRKANKKLAILEERYRWFSDREKLAIEDAYLAILEIAAKESSQLKDS